MPISEGKDLRRCKRPSCLLLRIIKVGKSSERAAGSEKKQVGRHYPAFNTEERCISCRLVLLWGVLVIYGYYAINPDSRQRRRVLPQADSCERGTFGTFEGSCRLARGQAQQHPSRKSQNTYILHDTGRPSRDEGAVYDSKCGREPAVGELVRGYAPLNLHNERHQRHQDAVKGRDLLFRVTANPHKWP